MNEISRRPVRAALVAALFLQTACGTIMYPQRRGQRGGRIDAGVAILDGIGLLFFIIPGVIAFAVDFGNGCIYLPGGAPGPFTRADLKPIPFDARAGAKDIERIVRERTGKTIALDEKDLQVVELNSVDDLPARFAAAAALASR